MVEHQGSFALVLAWVGEESGIAMGPQRQRLRAIIVQTVRAGKQRGLAAMGKQLVPLSGLGAYQ